MLNVVEEKQSLDFTVKMTASFQTALNQQPLNVDYVEFLVDHELYL